MGAKYYKERKKPSQRPRGKRSHFKFNELKGLYNLSTEKGRRGEKQEQNHKAGPYRPDHRSGLPKSNGMLLREGFNGYGRNNQRGE